MHVYGRRGRIVRRTHEKRNLSRKLSRKNCSSVRGFKHCGCCFLDPVRVLYAKSSSPKMSVDLTHPDMTEVKKVRVEKTLDVPVGEVAPVAKSSRPAVAPSAARGPVMVGSESRGNFSEIRVSLAGTRV